LTNLDISNNQLGFLAHPEWSDTGQGGGWTTGERYQHIDGRKQDGKPEGVEFKPLGAIALANAIPDMGALTSLNLSSNYLKVEGAKIVAEGMKVTNCDIAVVLVLFSCPSDHWLNCCCLLLSTGYGAIIRAQFSKQQPWQNCAGCRLEEQGL
jgi:hypothetical protein